MTELRRPLTPTAARIRDWLAARLGRYLDRPAAEADTRTPPGDYGFDSVCMYAVSGNLEEQWDLAVNLALLWHRKTLDVLTHYLCRRLGPA